MIDQKLFKHNVDYVKERIKQKDPFFDIEGLVSLYESYLKEKIYLEKMLAEKNELVDLAKNGMNAELRIKNSDIDKKIADQEIVYSKIDSLFADLYLRCPNIPADDLPIGGKEANKVVKAVNEKPIFSFTPKRHHELELKNIVNFQRGSLLAKSGFIFYEEDGADLLYALVQFFIKNNRKYGYKLVIPPFLVSKDTLIGASNLPRFEDDIFTCEKDNLYLIPTAEVSLAGLYRNEVLSEEDLPIRFTSWTSCFRKEAGGYGASEKGLMRIHQFEKVELFTFCSEEQALEEHQRMLDCSENILKKLGLHYQISLLATGDCSFASNKTYDIEVWLPGQNEYREIASISNCTDFQSRRSKSRFKSTKDKKNYFLNTLNGSSLAVPRIMIALIETYQKENGIIDIDKIMSLLS